MSERKPEDLKSLAQQVLAAAQDRGVMLAAAESCTGGLLSAALTDIPGCSGALDRAFVTYSNEAKVQMLGVSQQALDDHGAVSPQVAAQMASGALERSGAGLAVSITGIAGPGGATPGKPVGTVWLAVGRRGEAARPELLQLDGDRASIREQTVRIALQRALASLD